MSIYEPNLYSQSASFTYDVLASAGVDDKGIIRNLLARYKSSLPSILDVLMSGMTPTEMVNKGYCVAPQVANAIWRTNVQPLGGTSISSKSLPGVYNVPVGCWDVTMYEDEAPETQIFFTSGTSATYGSNTITVYLSATSVNDIYPIKHFQKDQILLNFSKSMSVYARVTNVTESTHAIQVVAHAVAAFTQVSDFITVNTTERIGIVDIATDFLQGRAASGFYAPGFRRSAQIKRYVLSGKETPIEYRVIGDSERRDYEGATPQQMQIREMAMMSHVNTLAAALLWAKASTINTTSADRQSFNGLYNSISTNTAACAGGILSLTTLENMLLDTLGGTYSSSELYGFCSLRTLTLIRQLFTSLAGGSGVKFVDFKNGETGLYTARVEFCNKVLHLMPVREFQNIETRKNYDVFDATHGTAYSRIAGNLFIVDPAAVFMFVGSHPKAGLQLCTVDRNLANREDEFRLQRDMIRSWIGFGLRHEKTSGLITNIQTIDAIG